MVVVEVVNPRVEAADDDDVGGGGGGEEAVAAAPSLQAVVGGIVEIGETEEKQWTRSKYFCFS